MDATARKQYILKKAKKQGSIRIADICTELSVSRETIRKDIYDLGKQKQLQIIRGGAKLIPQNIKETDFDIRNNINSLAKNKIVSKALDYIKPGDSIYLDFGSTAVRLAEKINSSSISNLTIVTNSINVVNAFHNNKLVTLIVLGGMLRPGENSLSGSMAINNIKNLYCNIGFFGCGGIDIDAGITNHYLNEVDVSKTMMQHSNKKILLADHSKFTKKAFYQTMQISDLDLIITDRTDTDLPTEEYKKAGSQILPA